MDQRTLINLATSLAKPFVPSEDCTAGDVAAALVTAAGHVYTGVCVDTACGRCRELLWQVDPRNAATWVVLGPAEGASLAELLPRR